VEIGGKGMIVRDIIHPDCIMVGDFILMEESGRVVRMWQVKGFDQENDYSAVVLECMDTSSLKIKLKDLRNCPSKYKLVITEFQHAGGQE